MRLILLFATAILLLTACADSDEDIPTDASTNSPSPTAANAVIFCSRIGDGSTPTTPTPQPSCNPPDDDTAEIAEGIFATKSTPPALPVGTSQLTNYYEFEMLVGIAGLTVSFPMRIDVEDQSVHTTVPPGSNAVWYTHSENGWIPLIDAIVESDLASGTFEPLPDNLIVVAEPQ